MYTNIHTYPLAPVQTLPLIPPSQHIVFSLFNHFPPRFHSIVTDNSLYFYCTSLLSFPKLRPAPRVLQLLKAHDISTAL